jgi:very-short-patch-repair endonuclease
MQTPSDENSRPAGSLARDRARELRQASTQAEQLLWSRLHNGRLLGAKFRPQHAIGPYVADFFCHSARLVIELDGGGHDEDHQRQSDEVRTRYLETQGYKVLRFWNNDVTQNMDGVLDTIADQLFSAASPRGELSGERIKGEGPGARCYFFSAARQNSDVWRETRPADAKLAHPARKNVPASPSGRGLRVRNSTLADGENTNSTGLLQAYRSPSPWPSPTNCGRGNLEGAHMIRRGLFR